MISLYLMNKKGFAVLSGLVEHFSCEFIDQVICSRDINVQNDYYDDIIDLCKKNNILYLNRTQKIELKSKFYFAIGWRWRIKDIDERLIVFHDSLLPKYRGFAPLVSCLINKEEKVGVTAFFAEEKVDSGKIINQKSVLVNYPLKIRDAIDKIIPLYQELATEITEKIIHNEDIAAIPQNESKASYSLWRDEEDYCIDWTKSAQYNRRFIDALGYPYKGASSKIDGKIVRILEVEENEDVDIENRNVGKVIFLKNNFPVVVCGKGLLTIKKMIYDNTKESALPLKRFRVRFGD